MSARVVLVLAAGLGTRMGGPKALLLLDGLPLLVQHARLAPPDTRTIGVVRAEVGARLSSFGLELVVSDEPDALGPAGSIRAAYAAGALRDADAVLITPVDVPPRPAPELDALFAALSSHAAARFARGHPIALRAEVLRARYREQAPILREVLRELGDACAVLERAERADDLDTPDDALRRTGAPPRFYEGVPCAEGAEGPGLVPRR